MKDKTATLIVMIFFFTIVGLTLACAQREWHKPNSTQQEFAKDKYDCMQQSQQRQSSAGGGYYIGRDYFPGQAQSSVVMNMGLFDACMEARGYRLR